MVTKLVFVASLALTCSVISAANPGVVSLNIGSDSLLHVGSPLLPGERVHLQYPDQSGVARCCLVRGTRAFETVVSDPMASDALSGNPVFSYRLIRSLQLKSKKPFLGAAVVGRSIQVKQAENLSLRVSGSDRLVVVSTCTSPEGFHVVGSAGNEAVSDIYLGLGYEVEEPSCPPK
jgi:hypothetical protein